MNGDTPTGFSLDLVALFVLVTDGDPVRIVTTLAAIGIGYLWWRDNRELARLRREIERRAASMDALTARILARQMDRPSEDTDQ